MTPEQTKEAIRLLKRAEMWLGKMVADGAHQNSVLPGDCENTLERISKFVESVSGCNFCHAENPIYEQKGMTCPVCGTHGTR